MSAVAFFSVKGYKNLREHHSCLVDLNLKRNGKVNWKNVLALLVFTCL